jgi:hypothetical protein
MANLGHEFAMVRGICKGPILNALFMAMGLTCSGVTQADNIEFASKVLEIAKLYGAEEGGIAVLGGEVVGG